jgi:hypothetical protein
VIWSALVHLDLPVCARAGMHRSGRCGLRSGQCWYPSQHADQDLRGANASGVLEAAFGCLARWSGTKTLQLTIFRSCQRYNQMWCASVAEAASASRPSQDITCSSDIGVTNREGQQSGVSNDRHWSAPSHCSVSAADRHRTASRPPSRPPPCDAESQPPLQLVPPGRRDGRERRRTPRSR